MAVAVLTAAVDAQHNVVFENVADLIEPAAASEPYLAPVCGRGRRLVLGEDAWLPLQSQYEVGLEPRPMASAWFSAVSLQVVLGRLLDREVKPLDVVPGGAALIVDANMQAVIQALLADLRQRMPPTVRCDVQLLRRKGESEEVLFARTMDCAAGRRTWASAVEEVNGVLDQEVEIAQSASVMNPVVERARSGAMVLLNPFIVAGEAEGSFEVVARVIEPMQSDPMFAMQPQIGPIDRLAQRVREVAGVLRMRIGEKVSQRWAGPDGAVYELRLLPTWGVNAAGRVGGRELEYLPAWNTPFGFRSVPYRDEERPEELLTPAVTDFRAALAAANSGADSVESTEARIGLEAEALTLRSLARARLQAMQPVAVRVQVHLAAAGAKVDADGVPANGQLLAEASIAAVTGSWSCATSYEEQTIVRDADVEVAQAARIPDPKCVRQATAGAFLNVRCGQDTVEIDGEILRSQGVESRPVAVDQALAVPAMTSASGGNNSVSVQSTPPMVLPQDVANIDVVHLQRLPLSMRLRLLRDTAAVWRAAAPQLGAGQEIVVAVRRRD